MHQIKLMSFLDKKLLYNRIICIYIFCFCIMCNILWFFYFKRIFKFLISFHGIWIRITTIFIILHVNLLNRLCGFKLLWLIVMMRKFRRLLIIHIYTIITLFICGWIILLFALLCILHPIRWIIRLLIKTIS